MILDNLVEAQARLKDIETILKGEYNELKMYERKSYEKAYEVGKILSEAKNIIKNTIGGGWLSWVTKNGFDKRSVARWVDLYEGIHRFGFDYEDIKKESQKTIASMIAIAKAKEKRGEKVTYSKTMIAENDNRSITFQVPKWLHEAFKIDCKRNDLTQQNYMATLLEIHLERADKEVAEMMRNHYRPN